MGNQWTKEQRQVIDLRNCNMLVSAAAGSGKTAVLVERIISRIMEKEEPVDIDRLLVVTFTNAAAAEMRERIRDALEDMLEKEPGNVHLQRQSTLINHARITTIHSFCLDVIRNHFHTIGLDPGFRIGDEGELKLLRHDVVENLLEQEYLEQDPEFLRFSESFAPGKTDRELGDIILQFYDFSMGYPWPEQWRRECGEKYGQETLEEFLASPWMQGLTERLIRQTGDLEAQLRRALTIAEAPDGPYMYGEALEQDLSFFKRLGQCRDYGDFAKTLKSRGAWAALSRKRDSSVSEQKKTLVKDIREQVKKSVKRLEEDYFFADPEQMLEDMKAERGLIRVLLALADKFQEAYRQQKNEKNIVDFNDLEHYALEILVRREGEEWNPTPVALEYAESFQEIMIDEYQDSNLVQEILLTSVSKKSLGGKNVFMVGDVKQSIYRFRLARPELFMEKYKTYTVEQGGDRRIDLHKNFRSRSQVLDGVNLIFRQIMTTAVGGVEYDEDAALYPGAVYAEGSREAFLEPELLLVERKKQTVTGEDAERAQPQTAAGALQEKTQTGKKSGKEPVPEAEEETPEEEEQDIRRLEAMAAAERIRQIVGRETVWDKEAGSYRPARYSDIVILLRTVSGWADTFAQVLGDLGIPAYTGGNTGYFSSLEIKTVLAYLQVLDNPRQDIPLASVLRSPIGRLTDEELALLRIASPDTDFYTCVRKALAEEELSEDKITSLIRSKAEATPEALTAEAGKEAESGTQAKAGAEVETGAKAEAGAEVETGAKAEAGAEVEKDAEADAETEPAWQSIREKLVRFCNITQRLRAMVSYTPMHLLLWKILDETGYGNYVAAMPGGARRKANLDMLVEKAVSYESTSYRGLFNFIRYIENLQKYEIDYGEASVTGEAEDTVRIMSIHKSKGLEFPIVLVCGMGKSFNQQDARSRLVLHPLLGVGCDYTDLKLRVRMPLLIKKVIGRQLQEESLGEELRVLYVAMTRAREKLILMGTVKDLQKETEKWYRQAGEQEEKFSYSALTGASNGLDWVMPALMRHRCGQELLQKQELPGLTGTSVYSLPGSFQIRTMGGTACRQEEWRQQEEALQQKTRLLRLDPETVYEKDTREWLRQMSDRRYPFRDNLLIPGKMTVSELKRRSHEEEQPDSVLLYQEPVVVPLIPKFRAQQEPEGGAARGTVYHRFLENLDFTGAFDRKFIESQLETMIDCGKIQRCEAEWISMEKMERFLSSDMALRMRQAARRGELYREQPFVLGVLADQIRKEWDPGEEVLIQGIIDAYFYEKGSIVLLDYKTDYVPRGEGFRLAERYRLQLDYYQRALERLTGRRVTEKLIYSFCLDQIIEVKE